FEKMKESLPSLKSLFADLQKPKNHGIRSSELVKTNVALLRELIYEADDILLDCQIYVDSHKESKSKTSINKKRLEEINGKIYWTLRTYCIPLLVQQGNSQEASNNSATNSRWTTSLPNHIETVGLTENVKQIKGWILAKNNELQRVGIVGMGVLGKTTLAQKVFNDKQVSARFKKRIWVSVSQPVDKVQIMRTILDELGIKKHSADSIPATLLKRIKEALTETTYLIIMDDVWSLEHGWWSQILDGLTQDGRYNSCIIITTRNEEVARSMGVGELRLHRPKVLGDEDSWSLLCKKCGGLPLAIKAIAGLLSTKARSLSEWQKIHEDFRTKLAETTTASDGNLVIASMQLSYDDLPSHLKQCILCCSIYPEDFAIRIKQLVYWWAGEGFVVPGSNRKTTIQLGYVYLNELFSRCLIEPIEARARFLKYRLQECKLHDMVRELIIRVAKQEAFSSFNDGNGQMFVKNTRHFGITGKSSVSIQPTKSPNSKIRAMVITRINENTVFRWHVDNTSIKWKENTSFPKVDTLRVLDLTGCEVNQGKEFVGWVKSQKRLTYLNLDCTLLHGIQTQFVKDLWNLQYLIIDSAYMISVSSLQMLRVLKLRSHCTKVGTKYPEGLANLVNLEELSGIMLGSRGNKDGDCKLRELIFLPKLRVLKVTIDRDPDTDVFGCEMSVLSQLGDLQVLDINVSNSKDEQILKLLDQFTPPTSLQELYIRSTEGEFIPGFITPELLPKLRYLYIYDGIFLEHMAPSFWGEDKRWNLETLTLIYLPELQLEWETVRRMMPLISFIEIKCVPQFKKFPGKSCKLKFGTWRKIEEEDSVTREIAGSKKRKRKA
ncbi:hypothetical protein MKX03_028396, partial [Papaver bracteatum]